MDIKNKANDIKINQFPFDFMPTLVKDINLAISEGTNPNTKLIWSEDLEYEVIEYEGSIYKDKASEYGKNSLYVLIKANLNTKTNELSNDPNSYKVLAVWQNKKFLGRSNTSYKSITAILNNDFYLRSQKALWLIIKNPKMVDYSYRRKNSESPQQQKNIDVNEAYKKYNPKIKETINQIKEETKNTILENDNPLEITKNIVNKIFANPNSKWNIMHNEIDRYTANLNSNSNSYRVRNLYNNLVSYYLSLINIINPENPINQLEIDEERKIITKKIKENKYFPEEPNDIQIRDKSGYIVNLSKWLEKKWDKFKNSNNLLQSLAYEMQSEYNDLVFETKVTIKELIMSDEREDWMRIEKFSNYIVQFKNEINYINTDIDNLINFYQQNNQPIDIDSYGYKSLLKEIKQFIKKVKEKKQEVI